MNEVKLRTKRPEFFFDDANTEPAGWITLTPVGIAHIRLYINQVERENAEAQEAFKDTSDQADDFAAKLEQARRLLERWQDADASYGAVDPPRKDTRAFLGESQEGKE